MKRNEDFRKALGEPDEYFRQSVIDTLDQLNMQAEKKSRPQRRYSTRIIASFAALVLAVTGIIFSRQYIPGISPDGHVDVINPTPTVAKQVTVSPVLDTVYATIFFREAQKDDDNIRFTLEIQPKFEHFLIVSANYLLTSACKYTADFYGIQPEDPEQSMYNWIVDHGYQQAIAFELDLPWDGTDGIHENIYTQEKCQLRDDGSTVMTIVGPAADNNVYDLEWHMVPWNMEDRGDSFHPDLHSHGTIRLEVTDEKQCAVTVVTPYTLPVTGPQLSAMFSGEAVSDEKNNAAQQNAPTAIETDLSTVTLRKADTDGYGIFLSFEVKPRHEKTLIVDIQVDPYTDSPSRIGLTPDRSEQTILEWAVEHGFEELLDVEIFSPAKDDSDPTYAACFHSYPRTPEADGSVIVDVYGSTLPNTDLYTLCCRAVPWDMNGKNIYRETPDGAEVELALLWDRATYSYMKIPVSGEKETPEIIATYCPDSGVQESGFTVSLFRTSLAEYFQTWTNNPDYTDNWYSFLYTVPSGNSVFPKVSSIPMHACIRQEDGSVLFRDTVILPEEYPDTLSLQFANIQDINQVDPPVIMKKIPPVEEYSALAWPLSGEGYNDLLNGMDSRDGKVYVVKGTVQEVLSEDPLRVLINTSEDGTSQPVIVESPAYCGFTWEPGTYYRIYADVSSMENNIPVLTARYSYTQANRNTLNTAYTTITFKEAVRDGDDVHITLQIQPRNEKCIATSMADDLTTTIGSVADFYGLKPEKPSQTVFNWLVNHGYQENLGVFVGSQVPEENGDYHFTNRTEKCQLMDDGSSILTIGVPASDDNIYNLSWLFVPRNMEDKDKLLLWKMRDSGTFRLEIFYPQTFSATVDKSSGLSVAESDLSTLIFNEAVSDGYGIYLSAEVIPKHEHCLSLSDLYSPHPKGFKKLDALTGIDSDYKGQTLYKWIVEHNYEELLTLDIATPTPINDADLPEGYSSYDSGLRKAEFYDPSDYDFRPSDGFRPIYSGYTLLGESGTAIIDFVASADPDMKKIDLEWRQDLMKTEDARRSIFSSDSMDMLDSRYGSLTIDVTEVEANPEVIAEYKQIGKELISTSVDITSVKVFRTSLGEYFEITTSRDRFANDLMHCSIFPDPDMKNPSFDTTLAPVCYCLQQNGNSAIFMVPAKYAGELPDTIMLELKWEREAGGGWNGICYIQKVQ